VVGQVHQREVSVVRLRQVTNDLNFYQQLPARKTNEWRCERGLNTSASGAKKIEVGRKVGQAAFNCAEAGGRGHGRVPRRIRATQKSFSFIYADKDGPDA